MNHLLLDSLDDSGSDRAYPWIGVHGDPLSRALAAVTLGIRSWETGWLGLAIILLTLAVVASALVSFVKMRGLTRPATANVRRGSARVGSVLASTYCASARVGSSLSRI